MSETHFEQNRWVPPLGNIPSVNFEFLAQEPALLDLGRKAEFNFHFDTNTTLLKTRQFGEEFCRQVSESFGIHVSSQTAQIDALRELKKFIPPELHDDLHFLRKTGNEASHALESRPIFAAKALRKAHHAARWYAQNILHVKVTSAKYQIPPNPQEVWRTQIETSFEEERESLKSSLERQQAALDDAQAEIETFQKERQQSLRSRQESKADQEALLELASDLERQLQDQRKISAIRKSLQEEGLDTGEEVGLPSWAANIALGENPPDEYSNLPEEVIEDLKALGKGTQLPPIKSPPLALKAKGNFSSAGQKHFEIQVSTHTSGQQNLSLDSAQGTWTNEEGTTSLLPGDLREALRQLNEGPPTRIEPGETFSLSQKRKLWWAHLRRRLEPFGVKLDPYLRDADAIVVDKLKVELRQDDNGALQFFVCAEDVSSEELTPIVDKMRDPNKTYTSRQLRQDGTTRKTGLIFSENAIRAVQQTKNIRRALSHGRSDVAARLVDAPHTVLDPELFDLGEYSERVIGIGTPVYRVSRSMIQDGPAGSQKFELRQASGAGTENDESPIMTLTPKEKEELQHLLQEGSAKGIPYVRFRDSWVRVPPRETVDAFDDDLGESKMRGSLIVTENVENEQFSTDDAGVGGLAEVPNRPPLLHKSFDLFPHQQLGFAWLSGHSGVGERASNHGMLADDMGLGKTLQVLSLMSLLKKRDELRPVLLVAPVSLLPNWEKEADRFFPGRLKNRIQLGSGRRLQAEQLRNFDWVLASYETLRSQQTELGRIEWSLMVCDESHRIKNPTAQVTHAAYAMNARNRLALTGTPVQNSLNDLWSQFDWLSPGFLGSLRDFKARYEGARIRKDPEQRADNLEQLKTRIEPRILRRLKTEQEGVELPTKTVKRIPLAMSASQQGLYDQILEDFRRGEMASMAAMIGLFKVSAAPTVFHGERDKYGAEMGPKLQWLCETVHQIHKKGERVIIFAEYYTIQDRLTSVLSSVLGESVDRINGSINTALRTARIDSFNAGFNGTAMVLGPKATGVGLNITGANHVIHFTRGWNPADEAQATDRVYRIGQQRPVTVYRPIMIHPHLKSIEEHLDGLLEAKMELAKDILAGVEAMSVKSELEKCFSLDKTEEGKEQT